MSDVHPLLAEYRFFTAFASPTRVGAAPKMRTASHLFDTTRLMQVGLGVNIACRMDGEGGFKPWLTAFRARTKAGWAGLLALVARPPRRNGR